MCPSTPRRLKECIAVYSSFLPRPSRPENLAKPLAIDALMAVFKYKLNKAIYNSFYIFCVKKCYLHRIALSATFPISFKDLVHLNFCSTSTIYIGNKVHLARNVAFLKPDTGWRQFGVPCGAFHVTAVGVMSVSKWVL